MSADDSSAQYLSGIKVLVTRPVHQQQSLIDAIQAEGGVPISMPLIDIDPLTKEEIANETMASIRNLDRYDIVIFVSSNAAQIGAELIDNYWPQFPVGIQVIAIGQTTSRVVSSLLNCSVENPAQGSDSEAVLALPSLQQISEKRVAIVRGVGGRELLSRELKNRGAIVDTLELYRRVPKHYSVEQAADLLTNPPCDAITVHSGESLQQLLALSGNNISQVTLIPLLVPSERVQLQAQQAGFATVVNAVGADDAAMMQALQNVAATPT